LLRMLVTAVKSLYDLKSSQISNQYSPGFVFTTLYFPNNLQLDPIS
jgi:hypothetical protein